MLWCVDTKAKQQRALTIGLHAPPLLLVVLLELLEPLQSSEGALPHSGGAGRRIWEEEEGGREGGGGGGGRVVTPSGGIFSTALRFSSLRAFSTSCSLSSSILSPLLHRTAPSQRL